MITIAGKTTHPVSELVERQRTSTLQQNSDEKHNLLFHQGRSVQAKPRNRNVEAKASTKHQGKARTGRKHRHTVLLSPDWNGILPFRVLDTFSSTTNKHARATMARRCMKSGLTAATASLHCCTLSPYSPLAFLCRMPELATTNTTSGSSSGTVSKSFVLRGRKGFDIVGVVASVRSLGRSLQSGIMDDHRKRSSTTVAARS